MRIVFFMSILFLLSNGNLLSMYGRMIQPTHARNQKQLIMSQINSAIQQKDFIKAQGFFMQLINNTLHQKEKVYLGAIFDGFRKKFIDYGVYLRMLLKEKELLIADNKKIKDQLEKDIIVLRENCKTYNTQESLQQALGEDKNDHQEKKTLSTIKMNAEDDSIFNNFKKRITKEFGEKVFKKIDKDKAITIVDLDPRARFIKTIGFFDSDSGQFVQDTKQYESKSLEEELLAMRMGYSKLSKEYEECKKENLSKTDFEGSDAQEEQLKLIKAENKQLKKKNEELMVIKGSSYSEKEDKIISLQTELEKTKASLAQVQQDLSNCQNDLEVQVQRVENKQKELDALWERIQHGEFGSIYGPSGI